MKSIFLSIFALVLTFGLSLNDAEAKRFGGGKSSGIQRNATPANAPQAPAAAPANPAGKRSWLGPVAGLAAGLGLAALASHLGFGEEMANFMMIALLVMGAVLLFRMLSRKRSAPQLQYAGTNMNGSQNHIPPFQAASSAPDSVSTPMATFPAGFDANAFVRQAKLNFLRLQAAYDAGNLEDIRDFTSPEMFAEIKLQISERGDAEQRTDVVNLDAEVIECAEEPNRHLVSVRFHGLIREEKDASAQNFNEIWHLMKPVSGGHGWVVAGIQQVN